MSEGRPPLRGFLLGNNSQQVEGVAIAQTQRLNFVNALQGRVAGVEVINTTGVPGASSSITIRGVSSISSSNQPLMIVDGLPLDNKVMNTNVFASGRGGSANSIENRAVARPAARSTGKTCQSPAAPLAAPTTEGQIVSPLAKMSRSEAVRACAPSVLPAAGSGSTRSTRSGTRTSAA